MTFSFFLSPFVLTVSPKWPLWHACIILEWGGRVYEVMCRWSHALVTLPGRFSPCKHSSFPLKQNCSQIQVNTGRFCFRWQSPSAIPWLRKSRGSTYLWDSHDRWRHLRTQCSSAFILILNFGRGVTRINLSLRGDIVQLHMGLNKHTRTWSFFVSWFTAKGGMKIRDRRDQQIKWADHYGYDHRWKKKR